MRHFISLFDIDPQELESILSIAEQVKALHATGRRPAWLARMVLAMLFEKPSLRTRVSFEAGMCQLGGSAMFLGEDVGWQSRESTSDFTRVLAQYADFVVCRAKSHEAVVELASYNVVPIINGLTDRAHPCQALADLLTMQEVSRQLQDCQLTFVGDGNNVSRSLALAAAMTGIKFRLLGPREYFMEPSTLEQIQHAYPAADILQTESPSEGLAGADFIYTDVWTSMGQEAESARRKRDFAAFQVNSDLLRYAPTSHRVLHCLPAKRGEEITDEILDDSRSLVVEQAGNRLHAQKGLMLWLALQHDRLCSEDLEREGIEISL